MDITYDPHPGGRPRPGETVRARVAYRGRRPAGGAAQCSVGDDPSQGEGRPLLDHERHEAVVEAARPYVGERS